MWHDIGLSSSQDYTFMCVLCLLPCVSGVSLQAHSHPFLGGLMGGWVGK